MDVKIVNEMKESLRANIVKLLEKRTAEFAESLLLARMNADYDDKAESVLELSEAGLAVAEALRSADDSCSVTSQLAKAFSVVLGEDITGAVVDDDMVSWVEYPLGAVVVPLARCDRHSYALLEPVCVVEQHFEDDIKSRSRAMVPSGSVGTLLPWSDPYAVRAAKKDELNDFVYLMEQEQDAEDGKLGILLALYCGKLGCGLTEDVE